MRLVPVVLTAAALLLAAPGQATADVIFDPADAESLAATLAEATEAQGVCYGWYVTVDDAASGYSESVGSNFGAGQPVTSGDCRKTVEFSASITYTSESSEAEDSATYDVVSSPNGPSRADLDALGLDMDGLTGEDPDVVIGNAVSALPLLAADADIARPVSATPATGTTPADAQLTDDPGSDWWRASGGMLLWGLALLAAGALFAWWVVVINRRRESARQAAAEQAAMEERRARQRGGGRRRPAQRQPVPEYVPEPASAPAQDLTPAEKPEPAPDAAGSSPEQSTAAPEPEDGAASTPPSDTSTSTARPPAGKSTTDQSAESATPSEKDTALPDQKDKE